MVRQRFGHPCRIAVRLGEKFKYELVRELVRQHTTGTFLEGLGRKQQVIPLWGTTRRHEGAGLLLVPGQVTIFANQYQGHFRGQLVS